MPSRAFAGGIETLRNLRELRRDTSGGVAIIFGILLPALLGISALAIEVGSWYADKNRLQIAADAAAYSALVAYQKDKSLADATAIGIAEARASGYSGPADQIKILIPSPDGTLGPNSSRAVLTEPSPLFLSQLFLKQGWLDISTVSYATANSAVPKAPCMLALKPNQSRSILIAASVKVTMGCTVATNSDSADAIWGEGSTLLEAECATMPGNYATNGSAKITFSNCPNGIHTRASSEDHLNSSQFWGSSQIPDTSTLADQNVSQGRYGAGMPGGNSLKPGKYGKQVEIAGTVTLAPGIYYFTAGFRATNGAKITGEGVTIYVDQSKVLDIAQNVQWQLSAPTSGPTAGIAIMGNPNLPGRDIRLIGILGNVQGAVYFPKDRLLTEAGPNLATSRCTQIVAAMIDIRGSGTINNNCSGGSGATADGSRVRLAKGPTA
jgi:hypothetical protein